MLVGEKLAIVTPKPQTTRTRVEGIVNLPAGEGRPAAQLVLVDTPGVHRSRSWLDRRMAQEIRAALQECHLVLWIKDVTRGRGPEEEYVLSLVRKSEVPVFLLLNKIDLIPKPELLPIIEACRQLHPFREIIPISAKTHDGRSRLLDQIVNVLPEGEPHFPAERYTNLPVRYLAAEMIREQVWRETAEELPYSTAVEIERFVETPEITRIAAVIYCEREGQKGIIIGRGGQMLKKIGAAARRQIEKMLAAHVFLELFVKVEPQWRERRDFVERLFDGFSLRR